ncbi:LacI family transcriptional regulator [Nitrospirillum viridazoti]|uniref:LacI family transcriptional regulator n=1 Tax=Nitrospirillum amazonense TaxID=28077 RepID=A0A560IK13_9PROT|nr:LacI family transcriptional regulator [Nitrospirillum amazonense]
MRRGGSVAKRPVRGFGGVALLPTAYDVATHAGVSQSAVSRAFTEGASIAPATRDRVLKAAAELGYRPNLIARSLITRQSRTIGVVVGYLENQFYPQLLQALSHAFQADGYRLLLFTSPPGSGDPVVADMLSYRVDAVILASVMLSSHLAEECRAAGIPVLLLNRKTDSPTVSSVTGDNEGGGRAIANYLLAMGHRRFGYVAGLESSSTSRDREAAYRAVLEPQGFGVARAVGHYDHMGAKIATRALLASGQAPDAIFYANDHMAMAGLEVARFEFGLVPGRDLSIVGFDNVGAAAWSSFDLTTYSQPIDRMVSMVVGATLDQISHPQAEPVRAVVEGGLIIRASTRAPAGGPAGGPAARG